MAQQFIDIDNPERSGIPFVFSGIYYPGQEVEWITPKGNITAKIIKVIENDGNDFVFFRCLEFIPLKELMKHG